MEDFIEDVKTVTIIDIDVHRSRSGQCASSQPSKSLSIDRA